MDEHVKALLSAYLDGELASHADKQVRDHLAACGECRRELVSLKNLSGLLRATPVVERLSSSSQFAARVSLMLPDQQPENGVKTSRQIVWWLIPFVLFSLWIIVQIASTMTTFILTANSAGLLGQFGNLLPGASQGINLVGLFTALFNGMIDNNILSILNVSWSTWQSLGYFIGSLVLSFIPALMFFAWLVVAWNSNTGIIRKPATTSR